MDAAFEDSSDLVPSLTIIFITIAATISDVFLLVPLLTLILSSLLPLGIALATRFTADSHLVAIAAATLRRALATRAIAGSPSSLSPLLQPLGMFLARAIVDPHIILLSLLSPWLVLATRATGVSHFGAIAGTSSCPSSAASSAGSGSKAPSDP